MCTHVLFVIETASKESTLVVIVFEFALGW